jgi:DNA-binding transcriptional ArsR family regulator
MSIKLMAQVWELNLEPAPQLVLLALADHASDNGHTCYPSVAYLAWKSNQTERTVQRHLRALEETGVVTRVAYAEGGRGKATVYQLHLEKGDKKTPFRAKGDNPGEERVTTETLKGDMGVTPTISNHQLEPSEYSVASQRAIDHQLTTTQRLMDEYEAPVITTYPSEPLTVEAPPSSPRSPPPPSPTFEDWEALALHLGWNPRLNVGLNRKLLGQLHNAGVTAEQIIGCVGWMRADPWWGPKGVDLKKASSKMQEYLSLKEAPKKKGWSIQQEYEDTVRDLRGAFGDD